MQRRGRIDVGGESFAYLEQGSASAPLALCLHGFPDHPRTFDALLRELASSGFHAVAPWLRGYAPSTLRGPYDIDRLIEDAGALALALSGGRKTALVGHDWGAVATYGALRRFPERFSRGVTLAVPHPMSLMRNFMRTPGQLQRSWYMFFFQLPFVSERTLAKNDFALIDRLWRDWSPRYRPEESYMRELKACFRESMPAPIQYYRAAARPGRVAARRLVSEAKKRITVPMLWLHGGEDGCISHLTGRGQERWFAAKFTEALFPDLGHFLHLEDPERVNGRILDFLLGSGAGA